MHATSRSVRFLVPVLLVALLALAAAAAFGAGEARAGSGDLVWKHALDPTTHGDALWLCAPAPGGGMYACGTTGWIQGDMTSTDIWVVRYRANGTEAWSRTWDGPDGRADDAVALVADAAGDVYVAGSTIRTTRGRDSVVLKYGPDGTRDWATVYTTSTQEDEAKAIGLDGAGRVYVGGDVLASGNWNVYVARFQSTTGARDWTATYDSGRYDWIWGLAVADTGESYLIGDVETALTGYDALLVKATAAGTVGWARTTNDTGAADDYWETVAPAPGGGVLLSGELDETADTNKIAVARYSAAGALAWSRVWTLPSTRHGTVNDAAVAKDGGLWVTGYLSRSVAGYKGFLGRWKADGSRRFVKVAGSSSQQTRYHDVVLDGAGNAYVTGTALAPSTGWDDVLAAKYTR